MSVEHGEMDLINPSNYLFSQRETCQQPRIKKMQYRKMGRTGLKVSAICLGTMTYGSQVEEQEAIKIIEHAIEGGVNFFDTADGYVQGRSEEVVGKGLKKARQAVVLATKVALKGGPGVNDGGLSRKHLMKGIEDSLRRLGTDYIDLYYVHFPDNDTPIDETLRALDDMVHQGKVRYIACSNFLAWKLAKALWVSDVRNGMLNMNYCLCAPARVWG
jgi:aryl-alcohol dehydrogenase-like predicted oxidoreductase